MTVEVVVDRIEGELAVLEVAGATFDWPLAALPPETREGDRLSVTFAPIPADTTAAQERLDRLAAEGPDSDDIDL